MPYQGVLAKVGQIASQVLQQHMQCLGKCPKTGTEVIQSLAGSEIAMQDQLGHCMSKDNILEIKVWVQSWHFTSGIAQKLSQGI